MECKGISKVLTAGILAACLLCGCTESIPGSSAPSESTSLTQALPTITTAPPTAPKPTQTTPTEPAATEALPLPTDPSEPAEDIGGIGLAHLLSQPNAQAMVALYYQVQEACQTLQPVLPVDNLNLQELTMVLNHYRQDHPECFWFSSQFQYKLVDEKITSVTLLYHESDPGSLQFGQEAVESAVVEMLELLQDGMSDYDKAITLYDALIDRCSYVTTAPNAHNLLGALVEGEAVCEGYALAYQYLLMRAGIPAMYVTGFCKEDHAWNAMQLDGKWYYADPTRDDPKGNNGAFRYYGYFALTRQMMDWDHEAYEETIPLPEADSLGCNYYARIDHIVSDFDREQVTQWMLEGDTLRIFVEEWPDTYLKELLANINSIVLETNLPWYGYVYTINGREIIVRFY